MLGHLFFGIAHIAMLPPWEGFDETAHYSYLQQMADTNVMPRHGKAFIAKDVEDYRLFAPVAYSSVPPMEHNGGLTYKSFFESEDSVVKKGFAQVHERPATPRQFVEGAGFNWQSQHPPLYYLLLTPIYSLTKQMSWGSQIFILRLVSGLFAWIALAIVCFYYLLSKKPDSGDKEESYSSWIALGLAIWPLFFPSWFPEMFRMGNDSLCALIMALIWVLSMRACRNGLSLPASFATGSLLGLGCLTKSFFVPVTAGLVLFWAIRIVFTERKKRGMLLVTRLLLLIATTALISGWWYLMNRQQHGVTLGSDEMIHLKNAGGLLSNLVQNFSLQMWVRGHAAFVTTFAWSGTWSLARPPYIFLVPMTGMVLFFSAAYMIALRRFRITTAAWLPAWLCLPVLAGFSYHVLLRIALTGEGRGTSGYYLHFLAAPLAVALGIGLACSWHRRGFRVAAVLSACYSLGFLLALSWAQLLLFSGILFKSGMNKFYQFPETMPPLLGLPEAFHRLKVIAFPGVGITIWLLGAVLIAAGLTGIWKSGVLRAKPAPGSQAV